jgi:nitroreductase
VPDGVVWEILDAAIRGPSGGNDQRWRWLVVTDQAVKDPIAEWYLEAWNSLHRGRRVRLRQVADRLAGRGDRQAAQLEEARKDPNYRAGEHLAINIGRAPVWVFAVVEDVEGTPTVVHGANIFGAVQNLMLAARAHGLGSTLTMLHRQHEAEVAALLGLPDDARALALIPLGYPESGQFFRTRRRPVETVVYWDRWGGQRDRPAVTADGAVAVTR